MDRLTSQPRETGEADPASRRTEFRPGGYFPEGFPLYGELRLLTAPVVEAGKRERIRFEYTVGDMPIEAGMELEIWKHFTSDAEEFQVDDPAAPAHFAAEVSAAGVTVETLKYTNWVQRNEIGVFPYRKCAALAVRKGTLPAGEKVVFDLGGPQGVRMQHYEENLFNFRVVITKGGHPQAYAGDVAMRVTGGPLAKLRVQAPSIVNAGEKFPVEIVPLDEWVSLARDHRGLEFRVTSEGISSGEFHFDEQLLHYISREFVAQNPGIYRIAAETADGRYKGTSNPIWVERNPLRRVYFGELHQHTYLHDGRGVFEELYMYGRRVGLLDFAALSPHHMPLSVTGPSFHIGERWPTDQWPQLQESTKLMNGWEGLVSILGYEYSVGTNAGGHHNIYYNADAAPSTMDLDPKDPMAPVGKMLRTLQFAKVPTLVIPHIGGGPPDWSHPPDQRIERLFEVASVHGVFEESWQAHLKAGLRLGAIGAGDTHTTSMGISYPGLIYTMTNPLAGVYAYDKSRQAIWDGLHERRAFATTGNLRMLADFSVNGEQMGGELAPGLQTEAHIRAKLSGTAPILKVDLLKNSEVIHTIHPGRQAGKHLRVVFGDNIYQRRAAISRARGKLWVDSGTLKLVEVVHRDQAFELFEQEDERTVSWITSAASNDRDGVLVDISGAEGEIHFEYDDPPAFDPIHVSQPLSELKERQFHAGRILSPRYQHSYMEKMGVEPAFFVEFEFVNPDGQMDITYEYRDREVVKPGDYYYLRVEQVDSNKLFASPVWVN